MNDLDQALINNFGVLGRNTASLKRTQEFLATFVSKYEDNLSEQIKTAPDDLKTAREGIQEIEAALGEPKTKELFDSLDKKFSDLHGFIDNVDNQLFRFSLTDEALAKYNEDFQDPEDIEEYEEF